MQISLHALFTEDEHSALPFTQEIARAISKTDLCVSQEKNTKSNILGEYFTDCSTLNTLLRVFKCFNSFATKPEHLLLSSREADVTLINLC